MIERSQREKLQHVLAASTLAASALFLAGCTTESALKTDKDCFFTHLDDDSVEDDLFTKVQANKKIDYDKIDTDTIPSAAHDIYTILSDFHGSGGPRMGDKYPYCVNPSNGIYAGNPAYYRPAAE